MRRENVRILVLITAIGLCLISLAGCGGAGNRSAEAGKSSSRLKVVTTIFPQYDFARQIAGGRADVRMLLKPGQDPHLYEPTPQDIRTIQNADLFIYVGGENDEWVEKLLKSLEGRKPKTLRLVDLTDTVEEVRVEGMEEEKGGHDHEEEDHHDSEAEASGAGSSGDGLTTHSGDMDEHVWTSPKNAAEIVRKIAKEMEVLDPANAGSYRKNAASYAGRLEDLNAEMKKMVREAPHKTVVFGDRFPFRYLAEDLGLRYYAAFSGCSGNSEASAKTVVFLTRKVKELGTPVIFRIEMSKGMVARSVAEADGVKVLELNSCHNVTADQIAAGATYLSLMKENEKALRAALNY